MGINKEIAMLRDDFDSMTMDEIMDTAIGDYKIPGAHDMSRADIVEQMIAIELSNKYK